MSQLVDKLSSGDHPVSVGRYKSSGEFLEAVNKGFVLVRFTDTEGGTELGFDIDQEKSQLDHDSNSGALLLTGELVLDYVPVRCEVNLQVNDLSGTGRLIKI